MSHKYYEPLHDSPVARVSWIDDDYQPVESKRLYARVGQVVIEKPVDSYYSQVHVTVAREVYMDVESGLLVVDVPAYERWIGGSK